MDNSHNELFKNEKFNFNQINSINSNCEKMTKKMEKMMNMNCKLTNNKENNKQNKKSNNTDFTCCFKKKKNK